MRWKTIGCKCCRKFADRTRPWFQWCRSATWQALSWRSCRTSMSPTKIVEHIPFFHHLISSVWDPNHIQEAMLLFQPNPTKQGHTNYPERQEWAHQAMFATSESFGLWFKLITYWPNIKSTEKPRKFCRLFVFRAQNSSHVIFFAFGMSLETLICHIYPYVYKSYFDWLVKKVWSYNISPAICMSRILCFKYWSQQLTLACLDIQRTAMTCFRLERKYVVCFDMWYTGVFQN